MVKKNKANQKLNLPLTNYEQLIKEFPIIVDIQDGDGDIPSTRAVIRKTIIFDDGTKLLAREHIKDNKIAWFYYDYIDTKKMTLIKIHSESHDDGKKKFRKLGIRQAFRRMP